MMIYVIKRHGSNAANQSMTPEMVVGEVEASTEEQACQLAGDQWTCYAGQHFEAVPLVECSESDIDELNYVNQPDVEIS